MNWEKDEIKNIYREVACDLQSITEGKCSTHYFLRHVLACLRRHPELCRREDYQVMYDETVALLIFHARTQNGWTDEYPEHQQDWMEFVIDLENKYPLNDHTADFSVEKIEDYLTHCKKRWARENGL